MDHQSIQDQCRCIHNFGGQGKGKKPVGSDTSLSQPRAAKKSLRHRGLPAFLSAAGLLLAALVLNPHPRAEAQTNYAYRGALSKNFRMELTLSGTPAAGSVTGVIRSGTNLAALVKGTYSGGAFTGAATYGGTASGTAFVQPLSGTLSGGGATPGTLSLKSFPLVFNNQTSTLTFTLFPAPAPVPGPSLPPPRPAALHSQTFHSNVGFGYTRVDLVMQFQPNGSMYQVSGHATVHSLRPRNETTVLQISGAYSPGAGPTPFAIAGARGPNDRPRFTGSIAPSGYFGGQMSGMPSLGITSLYFSARPQ